MIRMWLIAWLVALLYVHLFNRIARMHLESGRTLQLEDLWVRWVPYRIVPVNENG